MLKTKLVSYLKYVGIQRQARGKKGLIRQRVRKGEVSEYEIGSIEDPYIHKTMEQIRRLVATNNALSPDTGVNLIDEINEDLRAANLKEFGDSWSDPLLYWTLEDIEARPDMMARFSQQMKKSE